jgi:hypothetical protein
MRFLDEATEATETFKYVKPFDVLAVIEAETDGRYFWTEDDKEFQAALWQLPDTIDKALFTQLVSTEHGICPFSFDPITWAFHNGFENWTPEENALLSCRVGLLRRKILDIVANTPFSWWLEKTKEYVRSLSIQFRFIAVELDGCIAAANGNRLLAYTYFKTPNAAVSSAYGEQVTFIARGLHAATRSE